MTIDRPMCLTPATALPNHSVQAAHFFDNDSTVCRCGERKRSLAGTPGYDLTGERLIKP